MPGTTGFLLALLSLLACDLLHNAESADVALHYPDHDASQVWERRQDASPSPSASNYPIPSSPTPTPTPSPWPSAAPSPPANSGLCHHYVSGTFKAQSVDSFAQLDYLDLARAVQAAADSTLGRLGYLAVGVNSLYYTAANQLDFSFVIDVTSNESSRLTPRVQGLTIDALNNITGGPYDSSLATINATLVCWRPVVQRCSQVSAKLESGSPFTALNNSLPVFRQQLDQALRAQFPVGAAPADVQAFVAVPADYPDTIQLAFAAVYDIEEARAHEAGARLGFALNVALEGVASVSAGAPLFEVGFTITPCHQVA